MLHQKAWKQRMTITTGDEGSVKSLCPLVGKSFGCADINNECKNILISADIGVILSTK